MSDRRVPKAARPETPHQAKHWDLSKLRYLRAGFCHTCAARGAWGHQIGFARVEPPGDCCAGREVTTVGARGRRWAAGG